MRRVLQLAAIAAALTVGAHSATAASETPRAPSSVTALSVVPAAGRAEVVVAIDGAVDVIDFTLENPRRIVLDFRGATLSMPARFYDKVSRGGITNVRLAQYKADVVRLVLDIDGPRDYSVVRGERDVRIAVSGPDQFAAWHLGDAAKGANGAATSSVSANAVAPAHLMSEPRMTGVNPSEQKAEPREIKTFAPAAEPPFEQPRITVTYEKDTEIRDVIASFATFANKTIVAGAGVANTKIGFMEIKDKPWDVALAAILQTSGLTAIEDSTGIITVDSYTNLQARQAQEPLVSQIVPINYAKAATLSVTINSLLNAGCNKGGAAGAAAAPGGGGAAAAAAAAAEGAPAPAAGGTAISSSGCGRGSVATDDKTNSLIITETQARLSDVMGFIKDLDVRTPLVSIKAKIITIDRTGTEQLGISYDLGTANNFQNKLSPRIVNNAVVPGDFRVDLTGDAFSGIANAGRQYKGTSAVSLIYNIAIGGFNLTSFLDALSQEELSDIQAEPSTTTLDNTQAELNVGKDIRFLLSLPTPSGQINTQAPTVSNAFAGIKLRVTPRVAGNRTLNLTVYAEMSSLDGITVAGPQTSTRTSTNEVLVGDGETAVISGLTQTSISKTRTGIPILSSLPLIGRLFSETGTKEVKQDLIILITPHILDDGETVKGRPADKKP